MLAAGVPLVRIFATLWLGWPRCVLSNRVDTL